jgi:hypothetical protein
VLYSVLVVCVGRSVVVAAFVVIGGRSDEIKIRLKSTFEDERSFINASH